MLGRQSVVVKPLHEELEEMGLDAEKVKRDILENSRGMPMASVNPQALIEDNAVVTEPTDDVDAFDDDDFDVEESEETDDEFPEIDEDFEEDDDEIEEDDDEDGEELDEAFKVQKMRRLTSGEKAKAKKARKKRKGKRKAYAKKYYARMKKKIAKRRKKLLKKYGKKGLEKLHKQRKRLVAGIDRLATLREELEGAGAPGATVTPVEEAAINAGWLALLLGEIFESLGDADVAEMLEAISDSAASLSEELEGMTEDELSEDQQGSLRQIFEAVAKALEAHEDLGSPSLMEAIEYGIENGLMEDEDEEDGDLDEDEELEDESPFDELEESADFDRQLWEFIKETKKVVAKATGDKYVESDILPGNKFMITAKAKDESVVKKLQKVFPLHSWWIDFDEGLQKVHVQPKPKFLKAIHKVMKNE